MQDQSNELKKYRGRVVKEGILKSLFIGIICGMAALIPVAFLTWFFAYKPGLFISIAVFAVVTAAVAVPVYFLRYRPSVKQIAQRIDGLGLEERMLTMTELEGDESFMARAQREDTRRALGTVSHMLIKMAIGASLIVPLVICCVLGAGMTTVDALYYADIIPSGLVTLTPEYTPSIYTVSYSVEEGGEGSVVYYTGDWSEETPVSEEGDQVVEGEDAPAVYAVAARDWIFISWSDGVGDPYRHDTVVDGDIFVQAIFEPMDPDPDDKEAEDDSHNEESGGGQGEGEGEESESQPGEGEPQEGEPEEGEEGEDGERNPSSEPMDGSGEYDRRNDSSKKIIDGQIYYGDEFDDGYDQWHERQGSDGNLPDDLKGHIEDYYGSIETGGNSGNSGTGSGGTGGNGGTGGSAGEGTGNGD